MKRFLTIACLLSATSGTGLAAECPWKEPAAKPVLQVEEGGTTFTYKLDPTWFKCAKQAGGTATLQFFIGQEGKLEAQKAQKITSYGIEELAYNNNFCSQRPLPNRIQVKLVGTGAMEPLSFTSQVLPVRCARCQFAGDDNILALQIKNASTPKGQVTLNGTVNEKWLACAREGSTLEARFYLGKTRQEVSKATQQAFVIKGLEAAAAFKKAFPEKQLCETGAAFVGVELFGTGEMADLNGKGRAVYETKCK